MAGNPYPTIISSQFQSLFDMTAEEFYSEPISEGDFVARQVQDIAIAFLMRQEAVFRKNPGNSHTLRNDLLGGMGNEQMNVWIFTQSFPFSGRSFQGITEIKYRQQWVNRLAQKLFNYENFLREALTHFRTDIDRLMHELFNDRSPYKWVDSIDLLEGETHHQGKKVIIAKICSGPLPRITTRTCKVVYKPRSLHIDNLISGVGHQSFFGLIRSIEGAPDDDQYDLATYKILPINNTYGYTAFLETDDRVQTKNDGVIKFQNGEHLHRHLRRLGKIECVTRILGVTDLHRENLIFSRGRFYLIDLEVSFDPRALQGDVPTILQSGTQWKLAADAVNVSKEEALTSIREGYETTRTLLSKNTVQIKHFFNTLPADLILRVVVVSTRTLNEHLTAHSEEAVERLKSCLAPSLEQENDQIAQEQSPWTLRLKEIYHFTYKTYPEGGEKSLALKQTLQRNANALDVPVLRGTLGGLVSLEEVEIARTKKDISLVGLAITNANNIPLFDWEVD